MSLSQKCNCSRISSVQSLSCVRFFVTPWTAACQASLSITNSQSLPKLTSVIELAIGMLMMSMFQNTFYLNPFTTFVGNLLISSRHAEQGFPVSSAGKESSCKKETPSSIPESGSSPREEDGTHSSIPAWRIPWIERSLADYSPWSCRELDRAEWLKKKKKPNRVCLFFKSTNRK